MNEETYFDSAQGIDISQDRALEELAASIERLKLFCPPGDMCACGDRLLFIPKQVGEYFF